MYSLGSYLPAAPAPRDAAAVATLQQAPQKWAQLRQPGVSLSAEGQLFQQAVAAGFVPDTAEGYATFLGWLVPSAPEILAAGPNLYDWYAFKYRFVSKQPSSVVPEAIRNAVAAGAQQEALAAAFARIYGLPVSEIAPPDVDIGGGRRVPKTWIISDQTDSNGRRTVKYYGGGPGTQVITWSTGGTTPKQVTLSLIGEQDPYRYGSGDDRLLVVGWYLIEYDPTTRATTRGPVVRWNGGLLRPGQTGKGQLAAVPYHEASVIAELSGAVGNTAPPAEWGVVRGPDPVAVGPATPSEHPWTDVAVPGGNGVAPLLPPPLPTGPSAPVVPGAPVPIVGGGSGPIPMPGGGGSPVPVPGGGSPVTATPGAGVPIGVWAALAAGAFLLVRRRR